MRLRGDLISWPPIAKGSRHERYRYAARPDFSDPDGGADRAGAAVRGGGSPALCCGRELFSVGEQAPAYLILDGEVVIHRRDGRGIGGVVTNHGPGQITGEIAQLSGQGSLVEARAGKAGCEALAFDAAHLRALIVGSAELGEIVMRALILRRTALIADGGVGPVVVGERDQPASVRIEGFLARNAHPYSFLDVKSDSCGQALSSGSTEHWRLAAGALP